MKVKTIGSLLGPLCVLLLWQLPSEGRPQASGSAAKAAPQAAVDAAAPQTAAADPAAVPNAAADPACQAAVDKQAFCANPAGGTDRTQLCAYLPPDAVPQRGYTSFTCSGQTQFDNYSWQTLVALNWPADPQGRPCTQAGPNCPYTSIVNAPTSAPRVWDYFLTASQVIPTTSEKSAAKFPGAPACGTRAAAKGAPPGRVLSMLAKADDGGMVPDIIEPFTKLPLIDRNLNYTLYEILLNQDEANYILTNRLNTVAGQEAAKVINFPCGKLPGNSSTDCPGPAGGVGSIEIKAAWRILDPSKGDDLSRYFWREQDLYISKERSANGQAFCIPQAKLGLVGFHILHKTASQPQWFWSTFEHRDNAPDTINPTACVGPWTDPKTTYSYFQWQCIPSVCVANAGPPVPAGGFLWNPKPPYASLYATAGKFGTQVVRCFPVEKNSPSSPLLDARWYGKLGGTVWSNYRLVGTQWGFGFTGTPPAPKPCFGKNVDCAPPSLLNSVQETYMQTKTDPTTPTDFHNGCIQCHALAKTVGTNPKPADFSFLLGRVKPAAGPGAQPAHRH